MKNNAFRNIVNSLIARSGTAISSVLLTVVTIKDPALIDQITAGIVAVMLVAADLLFDSKKER